MFVWQLKCQNAKHIALVGKQVIFMDFEHFLNIQPFPKVWPKFRSDWTALEKLDHVQNFCPLHVH